MEGRARRPSAEPLGITQTRLQTAGGAGTANVAVFGVSAGSPLAPVVVSAGTAVLGASIADALSVGRATRSALAVWNWP